MPFVRKSAEGWVIAQPPGQASPSEAADYLAAVRRELKQAIGHTPITTRHRVDMEGGNRGGYFADENLALNELLWEVIDSVRNWKAKNAAPGAA